MEKAEKLIWIDFEVKNKLLS